MTAMDDEMRERAEGLAELVAEVLAADRLGSPGSLRPSERARWEGALVALEVALGRRPTLEG